MSSIFDYFTGNDRRASERKTSYRIPRTKLGAITDQAQNSPVDPFNPQFAADDRMQLTPISRPSDSSAEMGRIALSALLPKIGANLGNIAPPVEDNTASIDRQRLTEMLPRIGANFGGTSQPAPAFNVPVPQINNLPQIGGNVSDAPPIALAPRLNVPPPVFAPVEDDRGTGSPIGLPTFGNNAPPVGYSVPPPLMDHGNAHSMTFLPPSNTTPPPVSNGLDPQRMNLPVIGANLNNELTGSAKTLADINRREGKDFGIVKDKDGNIIHRGADRDTDHNWWDVVKNAGIHALEGYAQTGSLGGAIGGGVLGAIDRNADEKYFNNLHLQNDNQKYQGQVARERSQQEFDSKQGLIKAQTNEIERKPKAEQDAFLRKVYEEQLSQKNRIDLQQKKEEADGKKWTPMSRNGAFVKHFNDGREEPLLNDQGEQEKDLPNQLIKRTLNDGTEVYTTGNKALDQEIAENYRQGTVNLEVSRTNSGIENDNNQEERAFREKQTQYQSKIDAAHNVLQNSDSAIAAIESQIQAAQQNAGQIAALGKQISQLDDNAKYEKNDTKRAAIEEQVRNLASQKAALESSTPALAGLQSQRAQAQKERAAAQSDYDTNSTLLRGLPRPKKRANIEAPSVSGKTNKAAQFTEGQARQYYKSQHKTDAEINGLIAKGRQQGLIY